MTPALVRETFREIADNPMAARMRNQIVKMSIEVASEYKRAFVVFGDSDSIAPRLVATMLSGFLRSMEFGSFSMRTTALTRVWGTENVPVHDHVKTENVFLKVASACTMRSTRKKAPAVRTKPKGTKTIDSSGENLKNFL